MEINDLNLHISISWQTISRGLSDHFERLEVVATGIARS
jgi:hypothetical protein